MTTAIMLARTAGLLGAVALWSAQSVMANKHVMNVQHTLAQVHGWPTKKQIRALQALEQALSTEVRDDDAPLRNATLIFGLAVLMSAYVVLQYALHCLEERIRLGPAAPPSAFQTAAEEPFSSVLNPVTLLLNLLSGSSPASASATATVTPNARLHGPDRPVSSSDNTAGEAPVDSAAAAAAPRSSVAVSGESKDQHSRFRGRKPANMSNLRFAATTDGSDEAALHKSRWSPVSPNRAIHEAHMISPCDAVSSSASIAASAAAAAQYQSPKSPRFNAIRTLMSGGNGNGPKTPSSPSKRSSNLRSPGLGHSSNKSAGIMIDDLVTGGLVIPKSPRSPRKFTGFVIPKTTTKKGGAKIVLNSPRKNRFGTPPASPSPRKANFDDEGFNDEMFA